MAGSNKITAKSSCLNSPQSIFNSINVNGMNFSPEQLKNYNSPNPPLKNTISSASSPSLTNPPLKNTISSASSPSLTNPPLKNTISSASSPSLTNPPLKTY